MSDDDIDKFLESELLKIIESADVDQDSNFTVREIKEAIKQSPSSNSAGPDGFGAVGEVLQ